MILLEPSAPADPDEPERLSQLAVGLQAALAERGLDPEWPGAASDLCQAAVRLARTTAADAPAAAFALMDGCRHLVEGLSLPDAVAPGERESELLDALDELTLALLGVAENLPLSPRRPLREVVGWLCGILGVTQRDFAAGVAVPERTLQRWLLDETAIPAAQRQRLGLILQALNELRFVFRGGLALAWLSAPNASAGRRAPLDLLDQPGVFLRLAAAARF